MKKIFITVSIVLALLVAGLVALATVDFNRLAKDHVYVQIDGEGEVERVVASDGAVYESYWYTLPAYNEAGEKITVKFSAQNSLRQEAYLKLYVKNTNEVTSYDEVQWSEIPKEVQHKLQ